MLIDEVKAALEEHRAWWDANGNWLGSGDITPLEDLAEKMARKLIGDEAKLVAAEELAETLETFGWVDQAGAPLGAISQALAAYRKAGEANAD